MQAMFPEGLSLFSNLKLKLWKKLSYKQILDPDPGSDIVIIFFLQIKLMDFLSK